MQKRHKYFLSRIVSDFFISLQQRLTLNTCFMSSLTFIPVKTLYPTTCETRFAALFEPVSEKVDLPDSAKFEFAQISCPSVPTSVNYITNEIFGDGWRIGDIYLISFGDGRYTISYICEPA